ncbi:hypothetical protein N0V88_001181 [Collariella sp. IMI 366227]|nr:hypothetical protein N0V88_001181 [Collariella sp. IMI 366227]
MSHNKNSPKRVSFEDPHSSASDEDRNPVEVVFDDANPYRRKSSLVATESVPPHLRRDPFSRRKTECLVHQFLANQQRKHPLPTRTRHPSHEDHGQDTVPRIHHPSAGTSTCEAEDISSEAGLDQPLDPKGGNDRIGSGKGHSKPQPAPTTRDPPGHDDKSDDSAGTASNTSANGGGGGSGAGQLDEKEWRREMVHYTLPRTPSQLDRRSASADAPNSRLLTKKQLSEMAWGVRELSRRLGSMRLKFKVKTIFLLTKIYDAELIVKTRELCRWLLDKERDVRYTVYVDRELKENKRFDVAGLVQEVRRDYVASGERIVPPVLSFALGSLGFLTKFDFEDYKKTLTNAFNEGVTVSLRLRFEATVMRSQKTKSRLKEDGEHAETEVNGDHDGPPRDLVEELIGEEKDDEHTHRPDGTYEVLNEVVVDRGPNPTMSNIEIFGDDEHFTSVSADGICVSTPTGSTAYNLAAGGSLCHPENPVMLVTAICAHTLSFRPVILPDTIVLRIGVPYDARTSSWASFDGRERVELRPGDYVTVSASRYPFANVQPHGRRSEDWINSISAKLGWNTRQRQKSFEKWK